jgi:hypothetical protein
MMFFIRLHNSSDTARRQGAKANAGVVEGPERSELNKFAIYDTVPKYLSEPRLPSLHNHPSNLITGRQLRAARVLAGLTQRTLGAALGVDERQVRFWERRHHSKPSGARHHAKIERALLDHGVILFAEPTPGARLVGDA